MNEIVNGIFYKDGKKTIALGTHYFPSFHPLKVPFTDPCLHKDEVERDLKEIKSLGFSIVRFAALGDVKKDDGYCSKDFTFVDFLKSEIRNCGLSSLVRINGYSLNLNKDVDSRMIDQDGNPIPDRWDYFVRSSCHSKEEKEDDVEVTKLIAERLKNDDSVLGYQIYNEPAYPFIGFYDYHEDSLKAYSEIYHDDNPIPKARPESEEDMKTWCQFRQFSNESLNRYLIEIGKTAKAVNTNKEVFTCVMPCSIQQGQAIRGSDFFKISEGMDFLGITLYLNPLGVSYYEYSRILDASNSIASLYSKHAWVIECDAGVKKGPFFYRTMMFSILASGIKGILPYQFRGDMVDPSSPEGNLYGVINNDLSHTDKYDAVKEINSFIDKYGEEFASSECHYDKIGILFDAKLNIIQDAHVNKGVMNSWKCKEPSSVYSALIYNLVRREGYYPKYVSLDRLGDVKTLLVPSLDYASEELLHKLNEIEKKGIDVKVFNPFLNAFESIDGKELISLHSMLAKVDKAFFKTNCEDIDVKLLENEKEYIIFVINHSAAENPITDATIAFDRLDEVSVDDVIYNDCCVVDKIAKNVLEVKNLNSAFVFRYIKGE